METIKHLHSWYRNSFFLNKLRIYSCKCNQKRKRHCHLYITTIYVCILLHAEGSHKWPCKVDQAMYKKKSLKIQTGNAENFESR